MHGCNNYRHTIINRRYQDKVSSILANCHRNGRNVRARVWYVFYGPKIYKIKFAKKKMVYPKIFVDIQIH